MRTVSNRFLAGAAALLIVILTGCGGSGGSSGGGGGGGSSSYYLIAGSFGDQWYATTLGTWIEVLGITSAYASRGVAYGNGKFVWVGDCGVSCYASAVSASDIDDSNYIQTDFGDFTTVYEVVFGNGVFVAVGRHSILGEARAWVSSDGINWTVHVIAGTNSAFKVAFGAGMFVVNCDSVTVCYSADGMTWTSVGLADAVSVQDVSFGNGTLVAMGNSTGNALSVWTSANGSVWSAAVDVGNPGGGSIGGAAYGNGTWVAVGRASGSAHVWMSGDGVIWSNMPLVAESMNDVIFAGGQFVAVGNLANIRSSPDGVNWTNIDLPSGGAHLQAVGYKP